jgi:hypothetical protein
MVSVLIGNAGSILPDCALNPAESEKGAMSGLGHNSPYAAGVSYVRS